MTGVLEHDERTLPKRGLVRTSLLVIGELMLTAGVVFLFFVIYQFLGKPVEVERAQEQLGSQLEQEWAATPATPGSTSPAPSQQPRVPLHEGEPFTLLSIPSLGLDWTVVEGVSLDSLRGGPGHYPGSARPGDLGNFAVAGHRSDGIFLDLDHLSDGDVVRVETRDSWFTYRVYETKVVQPEDLGVIKSNPAQPGAAPTKPVLTLTTCEPRFSNARRLIIHAELVRTKPKR